jgi:rhomboid protease GluP
MGANDRLLTVDQGQTWRLLAACFLHAGIAHLALNMMSLYSLGGIFERLAGPWRLLGLYVACGLGASALSAGLGHPGIPSVGASGAILGLAGALIATRWRRDPRFPKDLSDRLFSWLARPLGLLFAIGFTLQFMDLPFQLDNFAHLGGLLTGFAVAYIHPPFLIRKTDRKV